MIGDILRYGFQALTPEKVNTNSIMVLHPTKVNGVWAFDDPTTGLVREPFVSGIPEIIETTLQNNGIPVSDLHLLERGINPITRSRGYNNNARDFICASAHPHYDPSDNTLKETIVTGKQIGRAHV